MEKMTPQQALTNLQEATEQVSCDGQTRDVLRMSVAILADAITKADKAKVAADGVDAPEKVESPQEEQGQQ